MPPLTHSGPPCGKPTGSGQPCQLDAGHEPRQCWSAEGYQPVIEGTKHDNGKPRWDLLQWTALSSVVDVMTFGATKYAPDNWRLVPDWRARYSAALMRHFAAWRRGEQFDGESGLPHLAHVAWNALSLLELELTAPFVGVAATRSAQADGRAPAPMLREASGTPQHGSE
jgi:hypothetical protein